MGSLSSSSPRRGETRELPRTVFISWEQVARADDWEDIYVQSCQVRFTVYLLTVPSSSRGVNASAAAAVAGRQLTARHGRPRHRPVHATAVPAACQQRRRRMHRPVHSPVLANGSWRTGSGCTRGGRTRRVEAPALEPIHRSRQGQGATIGGWAKLERRRRPVTHG